VTEDQSQIILRGSRDLHLSLLHDDRVALTEWDVPSIAGNVVSVSGCSQKHILARAVHSCLVGVRSIRWVGVGHSKVNLHRRADSSVCKNFGGHLFRGNEPFWLSDRVFGRVMLDCVDDGWEGSLEFFEGLLGVAVVGGVGVGDKCFVSQIFLKGTTSLLFFLRFFPFQNIILTNWPDEL